MEFGEKNDSFTVSFSDDDRTEWIRKPLNENKPVTVRKAFTITAEHVIEGLEEDDLSIVIRIGRKVGGYWEMNKSILGLDYQLHLGVDCKWLLKHFVAEKGVRIFPKLNGIVDSDVWIGGEAKNAMPFSLYDQMVRKLPNYTELSKYVKARLSGVIGEYFDIIGNAQQDYENYLNKKLGSNKPSIPADLLVAEQAKFTYLIDKLSKMLDDAVSFSEATWQSEIISIIRLLFPKYVLPVESVQIKDMEGRRREIDIGLIDVEGNIDIVEIKKPFDECIMSKTKYRDNHVPLRELSGAIMQAEKYILYLQRGGLKMDQNIQKKYSDIMPPGLSVKIVNPRAMIIMGRSHNLSLQQRSDFEVVKRKYKNIADIITYDDMIERLKVLRDAVS